MAQLVKAFAKQALQSAFEPLQPRSTQSNPSIPMVKWEAETGSSPDRRVPPKTKGQLAWSA